MSDAKPVVAPEDHPAGSGRAYASNRPQISIAVALLLVLVSAVFLAGLFYASRVPSVQTDIAIWMGVKIPESEAGNLSQVLFIMFTFTSPLAIAMIQSLVMSVWNKFAQK